jgi:hypothetical protein
MATKATAKPKKSARKPAGKGAKKAAPAKPKKKAAKKKSPAKKSVWTRVLF